MLGVVHPPARPAAAAAVRAPVGAAGGAEAGSLPRHGGGRGGAEKVGHGSDVRVADAAVAVGGRSVAELCQCGFGVLGRAG